MVRLLAPIITLAVVFSGDSLADDSTKASDIPDVVVNVWRDSWSESADSLVEEVSHALTQETLATVDPEARAAAVSEFSSALGEAISWENMGEEVVRQSLLQICGSDLLNDVAPYFSDQNPASEMPEEIDTRFTSCWVDVELHASTAPAYAMMEFTHDHLHQILLRHGIDPDGL